MARTPLRQLRRTTKPTPDSSRPRFRPAVEQLEDRRLPAPVPVLFNLNPSLSALTISGSVTVSTPFGPVVANLQPQTTTPFSSLRSTYTGTILALHDPVARTLQFQEPCTLLDATVFPGAPPTAPIPLAPGIGGSGPSAPADYGGLLNVILVASADAAFREVTATLANPAPVALTGAGPTFNFPSTQTLTIATGFVDFNASGAITDSGRESIAGNARTNTAAAGTFQDLGGGNFRLVAPIAVTISDMLGGTPFTLNINGQLEGTGRIVPLQVCSFTPTPTGFTAQFNAPFDPAQLNLYDSGGGSLGPADVVLTGPAGEVRGSLVPGVNNTAVTFVATGGVLAPGSYTATLRSAADGFRDASGPLDGDGDGTGGDNFTRTFTVPAPARILSLPDFARGPGQPVNVPATAAGLPITLSEGNGVTAVSFDLRYNPSLLNITGFTPGANLPAGATVNLNTTTTPGVARVTITTATPVGAGAAELIKLTADVPAGTANSYTAKQLLDLANVVLNAGAIAATDDDAVQVVAYFGDITGNARYSALDATRALQAAVGLGSGFDTFQTADPLLTADITGNGSLNATDATRILQEALGIDQDLIPALPDPPPTIMVVGPDPFLNIPKTFVAGRGGVTTVPINLDRPEGLEAVDLAISFDPKRLQILSAGDVRRGDLTADFDLFAVNLDARAGTLRVGLGRTAGPLTGRGPGSVLTITFRVRENAPRGKAVINLRANIGQTFTALNDGGLDLIPDPSNHAGDVLDGQVLVTKRPPLPPLEAIDRLNELVPALTDRTGVPPRVAEVIGPVASRRPPVLGRRREVQSGSGGLMRAAENLPTALRAKAVDALFENFPRWVLADVLSAADR